MRVVLADAVAEGADFIREQVAGVEVMSAARDRCEGISPMLADADAIVCTELLRSETADARRLRLVQILGAGADGIEAGAVPPGCALCNAYGHEVAIAEWTLLVMLALRRQLLPSDRGLRAGEWGRAAWLPSGAPPDLRDSTVGLIGLGQVGVAVARIAKAVGMVTIGLTRAPSPDRQAQADLSWLGGMESLSRLLEEADFAVVALPLTADTDGLLAAAELARLGPKSYLINASRGPIVQEQALYEALRNGGIAGAALDVWYRYPARVGDRVQPSSVPFAELSNVVMTPHMAGWTQSTVRHRWNFVASQLARLRDGESLENVLEVRTCPRV